MRSQTRSRLRELMYRLQTEADSPAEQAWAVAIGVAIGCLPVYGLHLPLCIVVARLLHLSRFKMYLAANLNNPLLAPPLVFLEIQLGSLLLHGELYSLAFQEEMQSHELRRFLGELAVGSIGIGLLLGAAFGVVTYLMLLRTTKGSFRRRLVEAAARRYLHVSIGSWEFARGKLHLDPVYLELVTRGWLPDRGQLLDLGCGKGFLLALVCAYREPAFQEQRPADCLPAPSELGLLGIEGRASEVAIAASAGLPVIEGDLRTVIPPRASCVTLIDVLHYLDAGEQERLLARVVAALEPSGSLLIREADAGGSLRFWLTAGAERLRAVLRGRPRQCLHYRSAADWTSLLASLGVRVSVAPMSRRTPFANILIRASFDQP